MGASCGHLEIHGPSDGRPPPLCTQTLGPFACMCVPKQSIAEGTQILEVGNDPGKLVLRAQALPAEDDLLEVEDMSRQVSLPESEQPQAAKFASESSAWSASSAQSPDIKNQSSKSWGKKGLLPQMKNWMQDHLALRSLKSGAQAASYLHPLAVAVLRGRVIEAWRLIEQMEAAQEERPRQFFRGIGDDNAHDRIRHVGNKYSHSLEELADSVAWDHWLSEEEDLQGARVQVSIQHGMLNVVSVSQHKDFEILKTFAALCEVEFLHPYIESEWAHETVEELASRPDESFLHTTKDQERQDSILQVVYADALDEQHKMLWVCIDGQEVPTHVEMHRGVSLPTRLPGHKRVTSSVTTYAIVPLKHASRAGLFRLIILHKIPLSMGAKCWYALTSRCLIRRKFRKQMSKFLEGLREAAQSDALPTIMQESPRASFYEQVRRHMDEIEQKKKPPSALQAQLAPQKD